MTNRLLESKAVETLRLAEEAFAQKVSVGRCMHDRSDWPALLSEVQLTLIDLGAKPRFDAAGRER